MAAATKFVPPTLSAWLEVPVEVELSAVLGNGTQIDLVIRAHRTTFLVAVKTSDALAALGAAHRDLILATKAARGVPLIVVPFMGPKAREFARAHRLSWTDLSGNADIRAPGVRILIEGQPNRFASPGRPATTFSDRAARLTRAMLAEPDRWWQQRELANAVGISTGYVSKVVARLLEAELLTQGAEGGLRPRSPDLLLDTWAQTYNFRRHEIRRYHAVGRTGPSVAESLAGRLAVVPDLTWAATGLASAWAWTHFADHRLVTFYVSHSLLEPEAVGLRSVEKGENVWLVVPRDDGVFYGADSVSGLRCVQPVQTYLDLLGHSERAKEAAEQLRSQRLAWRTP